jgi:hypothetical protein
MVCYLFSAVTICQNLERLILFVARGLGYDVIGSGGRLCICEAPAIYLMVYVN